MSENDVQNSIMEYLTLKRIGSFERINNLPAFDKTTGHYRRPNKYCRKGVCDIIGCLKGRFVGIECKTFDEYKYVVRFYNKISKMIDSYNPTSDKEEHTLNQIRYITGKNREGAYCFFTYSLEHTIKKLGVLLNENRMCPHEACEYRLNKTAPIES